MVQDVCRVKTGSKPLLAKQAQEWKAEFAQGLRLGQRPMGTSVFELGLGHMLEWVLEQPSEFGQGLRELFVLGFDLGLEWSDK